MKFSSSSFRVGEIFINTSQKFEFMLENVGDIKSKFSLVQNRSLFGPKFSFTPSAGVIDIGEQLLVSVTFNPDILGTFKEDFFWELEVK